MKTTLCLMFALCVTAHAQHRLESFIQAAERNNPLLKDYANQLSSSALQRELIRSQQLLPQVSFSAGYLFAPFFNNNGHIVSADPGPEAIGYDVGITNGGLYSAQVNVEKNIFNGPITDALTRVQTLQEATLRHGSALTRRDLIRQVTDQYLHTYELMKQYELSRETSAELKDLRTIVGHLVEHGAAKQSEYLLLSIEAEGKTTASADAYLQFRTAFIELNTLCGISDTAVVPIDSVSLVLQGNEERFAFEKKYELDSLTTLSQQAMFETKYQPQVSVFFNTGLNAVALDNIGRKVGLSAGVNISVPLFDGHQRSVTRQQNELALRSIANYEEAFTVQVKNERQRSRDRLGQLRRALVSLSRQADDYRLLIRLSENELRQGQLSAVEYLTVLRNYVDLRKEKISAETDIQREINTYNYWN